MEDNQSEAGPSHHNHNDTLIIDNKVQNAVQEAKIMCNNGQGEGQNILDKLKTSAEASASVEGGDVEDKSNFGETSPCVLGEENDEESSGRKVVRFSSHSEIIPRSCIYRDEETVTETEGEDEDGENQDSDAELPFLVDEDALTLEDHDIRIRPKPSPSQMLKCNLPIINLPMPMVSERVSDNTFLQEYLQVSLTCAGEPAQEKPRDWKLTQAETESIRVDGSSHHRFVQGGDSNESFENGDARIERQFPSRLEIGSGGDSESNLKLSTDILVIPSEDEVLKRTISLTSIDDEVILSEGGLAALISYREDNDDVDEKIQEKVDQVEVVVVDSETSSSSGDEETSEYSEESAAGAGAGEQGKKKIVFSFRKLPIRPPLSISRQNIPTFENHDGDGHGHVLQGINDNGPTRDSRSSESATSSSTNPMTDFYFDENGAEDFDYYEDNYDGGESESDKSESQIRKLKDDKNKKALLLVQDKDKEKKKKNGLLRRLFTFSKKNNKVVDSSTIDDGDLDDLDDSLDINGNTNTKHVSDKDRDAAAAGPEKKSKSSVFSKIFGILIAPFTNLFKSKPKN